ncbi:glutathione peroxidase [Alteromonas pelagimontana]|uniref:Glutathione peroxidase n=1 Tax=Alteromonas pelagimontana TaxID=1858656 RepID=A0A6M4MH67_9ALTE|nr:glutathione peroxidase [Alteromonas pelagimontana]QJR82551.1 glutathione peroxidase [Alteromonas pelagimontana]
MPSVYNFTATLNNGDVRPLSDYAGNVMLIVNTASRCGFTYQYGGLEHLYNEYRDAGLVVLAFPCDQFGHQEPGSDAEIKQFCELNYGVSFPVYTKIEVNGANAHPLFQHLKRSARGFLGTTRIKWNFTKFLIDASGKVVKRYAPATKPDAIKADIQRLLALPTH